MPLTANVEGLSRDLVVIAGHFDVSAAGAVSGATGAGATPTKQDDGHWRLTFTDSWPTYICGQVSFEPDSAGDQIIQLGSDYSVANKTLDIKLYDISDSGLGNAAGTIHWMAVMSKVS